MAVTCIICSASCKKIDSIICAICNEHQHVDCALKEMPHLTQNAKENISKLKPGFSFGCKKCSINPVANKIAAVEKQLLDLTSIIKENITSQLAEIKEDLSKSLDSCKKFEVETNKQIQNLEFENQHLRKQLNRSDIIVSGLPSHLNTEDLYSTAISIGKACDVVLTENDINFCAWIHNKSAVLIKFNNVLKRDSLMKKYRLLYNLKLNNVMQTDIDKRVYLNNHFIPLEAKLHYMCRIKIKSGEIKSYRILIYNNPIKIKLIYPNKDEVIFTAAEFIGHKSNTRNMDYNSGGNIFNRHNPNNNGIANGVINNCELSQQNVDAISLNDVTAS